MRLVHGGMLVALFLAMPRAALPACDPGALAAARAALEVACPCAAADDHPTYVACVRAAAGSLPIGCRTAARRCAVRSTCGRAGAATCCRTTPAGVTRCRTARDATRCTPPPGGSACVGSVASCCDACTASGCATTTTTTTTLPLPCGGFPTCSGICPPDFACGIADDVGGLCGCFPDGTRPCGNGGFPFCNGTCPAGEHCGALVPIPDGPCGCVPDGTTACGSSAFPTCGGVCPTGRSCTAFRVSTLTFCGCSLDTTSCQCGVPGVCAAGEVCEPVAASCGCMPP